MCFRSGVPAQVAVLQLGAINGAELAFEDVPERCGFN
jgi:hypothetical protein